MFLAQIIGKTSPNGDFAQINVTRDTTVQARLISPGRVEFSAFRFIQGSRGVRLNSGFDKGMPRLIARALASREWYLDSYEV